MMTPNFLEIARDTSFNPPVRSLLDIDFYKFTMGNAIFKYHPDVQVRFQVILRDKNIPLHIINQEELVNCLDYARSLKLTYSDMAWLRGMRVYKKNMFSEGYTNFLETYKLPPYELYFTEDGKMVLSFEGSWLEVSMWETIALAIVSELYYRTLLRQMPKYEIDISYCRAKDRIYSKLEKLSENPGIKFADFGQRRRHSFLWQEWVLGLCKDMVPNQITGTSNTWMAFKHDLIPIGTNAHEMPMVLTALYGKEQQYKLLEEWQSLYGIGLRVFLPDTYGTQQFLDNAPSWLANEWKGMRQDSGDPSKIARLYINFLLSNGVNPLDKTIIFSDGLDVAPMINLYKMFNTEINVGFGWGTLLTNDFQNCTKNQLFRPFSIVCKVDRAAKNKKDIWYPTVKLSDNINKATGNASEVEKYVKEFGGMGRTSELVIV